MNRQTVEIVRAALKADSTVTAEQRQQLIALLRDGKQTQKEAKTGIPTKPLTVRRNEAARLLGIAPRTVDLWCAEGRLKKIVMKGRKRSCAITRASIDALVA